MSIQTKTMPITNGSGSGTTEPHEAIDRPLEPCRESEKTSRANDVPETTEHVTGIQLILILASMTLTQFVMMLDMSVIATVCTGHQTLLPRRTRLSNMSTGYSSNHESLQFSS